MHCAVVGYYQPLKGLVNSFTSGIVFLHHFLNVLSKHVLWQVFRMIVLSIKSLTIYVYPNEEVN